MKKIISSLSATIVIGSAAGVAACAVSEETLVENMNKDVMEISSLYLRPYILSSEQKVNDKYINFDYLQKYANRINLSTYLSDISSSEVWTLSDFVPTLFEDDPIDAPNADNPTLNIHNGADSITPLNKTFESIFAYLPMIVTLLSQGLHPGLTTQIKNLIAGFLPADNTGLKATMASLAVSTNDNDAIENIAKIFQFGSRYASYNEAFDDAGAWISAFIEGDPDKDIVNLIQGIIIILSYLNQIDFSYGTHDGETIPDGDHLFSATQNNEDYLKDIWETNPSENLKSLDLTQTFNTIKSIISNDADNWGINKLLSALGTSTGTIHKNGPGIKILIPIINGLIPILPDLSFLSGTISDLVNDQEASISPIGPTIPPIGNLDSKTIGDSTVAQLLDQLIYQNSISETIGLISPGWNTPPVLYFFENMSFNDLLDQIYKEFDAQYSPAANPDPQGHSVLNLDDIYNLLHSMTKDGNPNNPDLTDEEIAFLEKEYPDSSLDFVTLNTISSALLFLGTNSDVIGGDQGHVKGIDKAFDILGVDPNDVQNFRDDSPLEYLSNLLSHDDYAGLNRLLMVVSDLMSLIDTGENENSDQNFLPYLYGTDGKNQDGTYNKSYELDNDNWQVSNFFVVNDDNYETICYSLAYTPLDQSSTSVYNVQISCANGMNSKWHWEEIHKD